MSTALIVEAYQRQVSVDPARTPHYLDCLKAIGTLRGGEDWETIDRTVQVAYAEGKYTTDDVTLAYKYFGLWGEKNLTEDSIIGKYYAYLSSTTQNDQVLDAARHLWRIGHSRDSDRIMAVSEDRELNQLLHSIGRQITNGLQIGVGTAEQAEVFLGVDDKTPDDFIITMYTAKVLFDGLIWSLSTH